ncbi:uncharacterized protein LOC106648602 [Trichogramma pretiosum]|uniref:uncharacterized protein LOC106648602 n=1 Tax=Trichogramma pretiosum TaxID=7493 RepID=UPI0006C9C99C|nr:uncharacterized protein LOC106648602 [Trichogramma pretiosum]XP_014221114.1 uncharacterized protein LOC106648602 [Trichogramma pretiosum]XP_023316382.1 uncharacterized protein LOC106648602 [Trichogramma pretiosum]
MDFMVKRLMKMSLTFRNLAFYQANHVNISRFWNSPLFYKDKVRQCEFSNAKDDLMLITLQQGLSPCKLLTYIDCNKHQIKREHVLAALSSLQNFYRNRCQPNTNLHELIDFTKLCSYLKPQIKYLSATEIIKALNILKLLNVPGSNIFVITLFQHLELTNEELSFQDMYKVSVLIDTFIPVNISKPLVLTMKEKFITKILQINKNDINSLIFALCFTTKNMKDETTIQFLLNAIDDYLQKIEYHNALDILKLLCYIKDIPYKFKNLIEQLQQKIADNIDQLKPVQITQIIRGMAFQITSKHEEFYNETFIDDLIQKLICENGESIQEDITILTCLNSIKHVQMDLLDYISAKCYENPSLLGLDSDLLEPLVTGLAMADYKPVFWDAMIDPIMNNGIPDMKHLKLCDYSLNLACLECFDRKLYHKIFTEKRIISNDHLKILLRLFQVVKSLYPSYDGPWPSKIIMESFKNLPQSNYPNSPLLSALEEVLGDETYIISNVKTNLEHCIDHVIVINKDGYPINIYPHEKIEMNKDPTKFIYLEDLKIPSGSQVFLILYVQPDSYARNTHRMLGPYSLFIRTLESMSYTVIPINGGWWKTISNTEKTRYMMQAIKLKFSNDSKSTTV